MNGRVYDPVLGRFLSADPLVQAPYYSQSYNRYSYVWNNPLANVDPSGYVTETSDDCGVSMGTCTIAMGPSKGSNRKVQKSDVVAGTVGGNPEAQGELAESIDWFGVKVDASDNFIVCVTPQACSSPSNIRNATLTDGVTEVAMFGAGLIPVARAVPGIIRDKVKSAVKGVVEKARGFKKTNQSLADPDEAYHYTDAKYIESIKLNGLRSGSYATPNGKLSPLQAQLDLALPPNRGLPGGKLSIDLKGMRSAGYEIPQPKRVSSVVTGADGRVYSQPGGGYEMQFGFEIPSEFIKVVK